MHQGKRIYVRGVVIITWYEQHLGQVNSGMLYFPTQHLYSADILHFKS